MHRGHTLGPASSSSWQGRRGEAFGVLLQKARACQVLDLRQGAPGVPLWDSPLPLHAGGQGFHHLHQSKPLTTAINHSSDPLDGKTMPPACLCGRIYFWYPPHIGGKQRGGGCAFSSTGIAGAFPSGCLWKSLCLRRPPNGKASQNPLHLQQWRV